MQNFFQRDDSPLMNERGELRPVGPERKEQQTLVSRMDVAKLVSAFCFFLFLLCAAGCPKRGKTAVSSGPSKVGDNGENTDVAFDTSSPAESDKKMVGEKRICIIEELGAEHSDESDIRERIVKENIGGLFLGMDAEKAVALLGEPDSKTEPVEEAATGAVVSEWTWNTKGVRLIIDCSEKNYKVRMIDVRQPFRGKTSCGIGVGDSMAAANKIYGKYLDEDHSGSESMVAGSIYGGILFKKGADTDEITSISIGAFAE